MNTIRVAVPVESGEGLEARRSAHFGRSEAFAVVDVADGQTGDVQMLANPPHGHAGCMSTVALLVSHHVTDVVASGIGQGPLSALTTAGIAVHHESEAVSVGGAVEAFVGGKTRVFGDEHVCRGH